MNSTSYFFSEPSGIMYETGCEPMRNCNTDQLTFKAYLSRFMSYASQVAPFIADNVYTHLTVSAAAAAASCSGGADGTTCGTSWLTGNWDGTTGVGQQMSAMETIQNLMLFTTKRKAPVTTISGGNSTGNPTAGSSGDANVIAPKRSPTTAGDRVGAGFLTAAIVAVSGAGFVYMAL